MKRWIKNKQDVDQLEPIYCGIYLKQDTLNFNWKRDDVDNDIIMLAEDISREFDSNGIRYIYAYEYSASAKESEKKRFRTYMKNLPESPRRYSKNVDRFIETGVLRLDQYQDLKSFEVTITTQSSHHPSLTDLMDGMFAEYCSNTRISFELLKQSYKDVEFDEKAAAVAMREAGISESDIVNFLNQAKGRFESYKETNEIFQMKKFIPRAVRAGFKNFLKFKTPEEEAAYRALQGVNVLIYDDFLTSGATTQEIARYLKSFNNTNTLTVFVLVKQ